MGPINIKNTFFRNMLIKLIYDLVGPPRLEYQLIMLMFNTFLV